MTMRLKVTGNNAYHRPPMMMALKTLRTLVVDDNETNQRILSKMLANWNMTAQTAPSAETGMKLLVEASQQGVPFDLLLLDGQMPGTDGLTMASQIRAIPSFNRLKIVMLTSAELLNNAEQLDQLDISRYLIKPVAGHDLREVIVASCAQMVPSLSRARHRQNYSVALSKSQFNLKILVAEDNLVNQKLARKVLEIGAAYLGVSPLHMLFPRDRGRASPYYPSDRRFLDPIYIDVLDDQASPAMRRSTLHSRRSAPRFTAASETKSVEYEEVWLAKHAALQARSASFLRLRTARPGDPLIADYHAFARSGGGTLRRFAAFQAAAEGEAGGNWPLWPQGLRDRDPQAIDHAVERNRAGFEFALFCQWLADRQLGRAAGRARDHGLEIGLYRDLAVGAAPDGTEAWAHAGALAQGVTVGAPPDPFSVQGQNWGLPAPNPLAGAREGWASVSAVYRANMRHAGMLRIDHAMGLQRLFLIPDGARPADGAYLSYPLDDLSAISRSKANAPSAW